MRALDRLLDILSRADGDTVQLRSGEPAVLVRDGTTLATTRGVLTREFVLEILREKLPAGAEAELANGIPIALTFAGPGGSYEAAARADDRACDVSIRRVRAA